MLEVQYAGLPAQWAALVGHFDVLRIVTVSDKYGEHRLVRGQRKDCHPVWRSLAAAFYI